MKLILEITGLGVGFLGAAILAVNAISLNSQLFRIGSMRDKLRRPIVTIVGLVILTIGFGLQFVAVLLR